MLARGATAPLGGNRITEDFGAGERAGTVDAQDRLQACGNRTYQYDPQGRRTATDCNGFLTRYRYNGLGEMTGVELPNGNVIDYLYDAMGQRIGRKKNGVLEQGWLYQSRLKIAGELDGSNTLRAVFLQGHGPNVPDGMVKAGHTYRLLTDHLGSVGYVVNIDTGEVSQALEYDEWGKLLRDSNPGYQPFGYAGGLYDPDTGLVRFGMRDYDPREGRWLTKDPIGLQGGYNVYSYVEGNPISYTDPMGLDPVVPNPNNIVPGGPWTPKPGGKPGEFLGPKKPTGGRDQCTYVPDKNNGGPPGANDPYWKTKSPDGPWQRHNQGGDPISPEDAHPGNPRPTPTNPLVPIITRILVGAGLMGYSGDAW